uniref:DUF4371 domain-containing protein n=1 Tax=Heterorhabditis bacteriophora TaxID=37862 RepID=A0A1I7WPD7_HETBA
MKGYGSSLAPVHAGIKYDLEQLLMKFKETDSYRFRSFSEVFRSMEMNLIFAGRQSAAELIESIIDDALLKVSVHFILLTLNCKNCKYIDNFTEACELVKSDKECTNYMLKSNEKGPKRRKGAINDSANQRFFFCLIVQVLIPITIIF